jgi:hypothetical protein
MTEDALDQGPLRSGSSLRTPRAAAVAGIVFSVLLISALVLLRISVPARPGGTGAWLTEPGKRAAVAVALNLIPFAGIAFLWFIGVVRDRVGEREDRFFASVFLGSGLLFVAMLFVAAAVSGGLIAGASSGLPDSSTLALARNITTSLLNVYSMRMAAVFTLTTVTIARRTQIVSRWLTRAGLVCALVLMIGIGISPWVELVFPAWILALSVEILAGRPPGSGTMSGLAAWAGGRDGRLEEHPAGPDRGPGLARAVAQLGQDGACGRTGDLDAVLAQAALEGRQGGAADHAVEARAEAGRGVLGTCLERGRVTAGEGWARAW